MADAPQKWDESPPDQPVDAYDRPPPELSPAQRETVFRAQLILFLVMGVFIIAPFVAWWLLSRGQ
jgi:hypothetical protein